MPVFARFEDVDLLFVAPYLAISRSASRLSEALISSVVRGCGRRRKGIEKPCPGRCGAAAASCDAARRTAKDDTREIIMMKE